MRESKAPPLSIGVGVRAGDTERNRGGAGCARCEPSRTLGGEGATAWTMPGVGGSNRVVYVNIGETGLVVKNVGSHKSGDEF